MQLRHYISGCVTPVLFKKIRQCIQLHVYLFIFVFLADTLPYFYESFVESDLVND